MNLENIFLLKPTQVSYISTNQQSKIKIQREQAKKFYFIFVFKVQTRFNRTRDIVIYFYIF